jgi:hypothetical protein
VTGGDIENAHQAAQELEKLRKIVLQAQQAYDGDNSDIKEKFQAHINKVGEDINKVVKYMKAIE